jgi:hypothetical protein
VLTPPSTRRCTKIGRTTKNKLSSDLDGPAPFMNADSVPLRGAQM